MRIVRGFGKIFLYGALFALFMALCAYYNYWYEVSPFGFEYGNIAEALSTGKGFSNPFGVESGPTAWMPPFYVYFISSIFLLFGVKSAASMWFALVIEAIALTFTCYMLIKLAEQTPFARCKYLIVLMFLFPILLNMKQFFMGLHDIWVMVCISVFIIYTIVNFIKVQGEISLFQLSIIAMLLPLISPSLSLGFAVAVAGFAFITAVKIARTQSDELSFASFNTSNILRYSVFTGIVFLVSAGSWTMRNYNEFGKFIPIKANFWFDFYQGNLIDADGVVSSSTFMTVHPTGNEKILANYVELGEAGFIDEYEARTRSEMPNNKAKYLTKMGNRFVNAFIFTRTESDISPVQVDKIDPDDLQLLIANQIVRKERWLNLEHDEEDVRRKFIAIGLKQPDKYLELWNAARVELDGRVNSMINKLRGYSVALFPFLCILGILLFSNKDRIRYL